MTALRQPSTDFAGPVYAKWVPPEFVNGQRIAVIGDAARLAAVVPQLVRTAAFVKVFQDESAWAVAAWLPAVPRSLQRRVARATLRTRVRDPWLRRQLTPYRHAATPGITGAYLRAIQSDNCTLITWPITAYVPEGLRTADGIEHHIDAIVMA